MYQKLLSYDTIPAEFTQARNAINQYATDNDGYKVLYKLIEPLLHHDDEVATAPKEEDWKDIHEYANKFQSYINSEALKGRHYSPKEQTKKFLAGLTNLWTPAIRRARSLLDNSSPADPTVQTVLKIKNIPATLDRWLKEETGQSVIRTAYTTTDRTNKDSQDSKGRYKTITNSRYQPDDKGLIKKCPICLGTNHTKYQCLSYARYLACREADQRADETMRTKVIEHFKAEMKRKTERGRKRAQLGTVRQLWEEGKSFEDIETLLLDTMPELEDDTSESESDE